MTAPSVDQNHGVARQTASAAIGGADTFGDACAPWPSMTATVTRPDLARRRPSEDIQTALFL